MCGRSGKDFPVGSDTRHKMGSCVFQCDIPHQWIAQRQVGPVSVYCDGMGCHVVSAAWHSCVAAHWSKYHCYKQAPSQYDLRCLKATLNPNKPGKKGPVFLTIPLEYLKDQCYHRSELACTNLSHTIPLFVIIITWPSTLDATTLPNIF